MSAAPIGKPRVSGEWAKFYAEGKSNHPVIRDLALDLKDARAALGELEIENARLVALINNPHTNSFLDAVRLEAAHQRERWKAEHDGGKTDADWLWLIGHLVGKAVNAGALALTSFNQDETHHRGKRLHHIITSAAACLNWHMQRTAGNDMRPGIDTKEPA